MSNDPTPKRFTKVKIKVKDGEHEGYRWSKPTYTDGLLFEAGATTDELIGDPKVRELVGSFMVIQELDSGIAIHGDVRAVKTPDMARQGDVVAYADGNVLKKLPVVKRFMQCREPVRDILGCEHCQYVGVPCLSGVPHNDPITNDVNPADSDAWGKLRDKKTVVAGHTFVSPVMLAEDGETFVKGDRKPDEIDWSAEEERRRGRRNNASRAAASRKFIKTECGKCIAKDGGCRAYNSCKGAYPAEDAHEKAVREQWFHTLDEKGALAPWQLYAIMNLAGIPGNAVWARRRVVLGGLTHTRDGYAVRICAARMPADHRHAVTTDWKRLREVFPSLPEAEGGLGTARPSDKALIMYLAAMHESRFRPVLRGFQGYVSDPIAYLHTLENGVYVHRARWHVLPRGEHTWNGSEIQTWSEFYSTFGTLPAGKVPARNFGF